jgi:hypothetical protein
VATKSKIFITAINKHNFYLIQKVLFQKDPDPSDLQKAWITSLSLLSVQFLLANGCPQSSSEPHALYLISFDIVTRIYKDTDRHRDFIQIKIKAPF